MDCVGIFDAFALSDVGSSGGVTTVSAQGASGLAVISVDVSVEDVEVVVSVFLSFSVISAR